ncbi:acyl-CoA thioesterase [Anaeroselena agilis]|uniref:Hotdog domain-containing protein n=1 Tax=Anaeroselena agilis TaxID=3063788 RepID=A0ABU3P160_9FIRM|nr:hotdog domain-containing protein [Selenomonadales bacterium 4137-cl]
MSKTVNYSDHRFSKVMVSSRTKPAGRVRAGEIMQMLYNAAHKVAQKHAGADVTAIRVEEILFLQPLHYGSLVTGHAYLTFVGETSMEVKVDLYLDNGIDSTPLLTCYFVMVALDEHQHPKKVPSLEVNTEQEKELFAEGKRRYLQRKSELQPK